MHTYIQPKQQNKQTKKRMHPRWDSNPQFSAPETDALSIWPLGRHMPEVGFEPTRTESPADLQSAPLDLSGIQACELAVETTWPPTQHTRPGFCRFLGFSKNDPKKKKVLPGLEPGLRDSE